LVGPERERPLLVSAATEIFAVVRHPTSRSRLIVQQGLEAVRAIVESAPTDPAHVAFRWAQDWF
jgi:hypothetical protein